MLNPDYSSQSFQCFKPYGENVADKHREYLAAREKWVHEDQLINHRLTWLLVSQTLLFAAYGALLNTRCDVLFLSKISKILDVLPLLGIGIALVLLLSILAACHALRILRNNKDSFQLQASTNTHLIGLIAPVLLPVIFIFAWSYIWCL